MTDYRQQFDELIQRHEGLFLDIPRRDLIKHAVDNGEAMVSANGALATWTPTESTGRSPKDTYIVKEGETVDTVDWTSSNNLPIDRETFDMVLADALGVLRRAKKLYVTHRAVGADPSYALPVQTISDNALMVLFSDNVFRPLPEGIDGSCFFDRPFKLITCPYHKLDRKRYEGRLRKLPDGRTSDLCVAIDFDRRLGVVFGSAYCGSNKKLIFTVMNYLLPAQGILPLHCSANEGPSGDIALLLGLSGTGKTTLSADPERALLGDDEHGWSDNGTANFENGCYAKLINLRRDKEPEIFHAVFHDADFLEHGAIIENCMMYPNGAFDVDDERLTPNSRGSYPLSFLTNIKPSSMGGHPSTILFLTADANGVLPPVAKLSQQQAMVWFLMGYTSKLAGTETGIVDPVSTFSRFFGAPFMPRLPDVYASALGERMQRHGTNVYLVNTGWSGGPFGVGHRMDINLTRAIVRAALAGNPEDVAYRPDDLFHFSVPTSCPGI